MFPAKNSSSKFVRCINCIENNYEGIFFKFSSCLFTCESSERNTNNMVQKRKCTFLFYHSNKRRYVLQWRDYQKWAKFGLLRAARKALRPVVGSTTPQPTGCLPRQFASGTTNHLATLLWY